MDSYEGLLHSCILDGNGGGTVLDWQDISDWQPEKGLLWIHLDYSNENVKQWLQTESKLSALSCDILMEPDTRPRFITTLDGFLLILEGVEQLFIRANEQGHVSLVDRGGHIPAAVASHRFARNQCGRHSGCRA